MSKLRRRKHEFRRRDQHRPRYWGARSDVRECRNRFRDRTARARERLPANTRGRRLPRGLLGGALTAESSRGRPSRPGRLSQHPFRPAAVSTLTARAPRLLYRPDRLISRSRKTGHPAKLGNRPWPVRRHRRPGAGRPSDLLRRPISPGMAAGASAARYLSNRE